MYLDAFTNDVTGQNSYSHHIHALDITTGADKMTPMLVAASIQGSGVGGNGTTVPFVATQQLQRPALTLLNGVLYVCYSGYADTDPYHGWILGFNASNLQLVSVLNTTPNVPASPDANQGEGGIWQTGDGLVSDGTNLYVETANGDFDPTSGDYSDSFLRITPDSTTAANPHLTGYGLNVADYFTPYNEQALADADSDLGSGGALLLPPQPGAHPNELIGSGKQGVVYVVDASNMGHHNLPAPMGPGNDSNAVETINLGHGNFDSPAYFNGTVYYNAVNDALKGFTLSNGLLPPAPSMQATVSYSGSGQGATPSISANGTANGIVWNIQFDGSHEVLHAFDASNLTELYNSNQNAPRDQLGGGVKFITPTIADGEVFVGGAGFVTVFGLLAPPTQLPAAPSNLTAAALGATQVQLQWVNNSSSQSNAPSGYKIERATGNGPFAQIAVASAGALSYVDSTVSPSTTYNYQIRATNVIGDSAYAGPVSVTTPAVTGAVDVYHFDAGSGTSAVDSVGTNNGTLTGTTKPTWTTPGKIGAAALTFSGNGTFNQAVGNQSAVTLANDLSPILGATSSLDVWVKTTQVGNATHWMAPAITGVEQSGAGNDINWGTLDASGHIGIYVGDSGGIFSTNPVNDGQWHNVAMTRNATTGQVQLYVDGVLNGTGTFDTGAKTSQFSVIGALADVANNGTTPTGDNYFNGSIDEVRIYNQLLTASDIKSLALIPAAPTITSATASPGPVVHLVWSTPSNFTQSIEVDRKTGAGGTYAAIATLGGGVVSYDDVNVVRGTQYFYVVKAIDLAGTSPVSNEVNVTPPIPTIVANSVFYNNSLYDGFNGSSNIPDSVAVATNKQALLPGQTATFQNVTGYSKGINGIIIDVSNLDNLPRFEDYSFEVWDGSNPSGWVTAPAPSIINVYPGRGPNGSTQITIIWPDNAIQNEWLQAAILANAHTGLPADDTFYFGNLVGATGMSNTSAAAMVGSADFDAIVADPHGPFNKAAITSANDVNHDGLVNANDAIYARNNAGNILPFITAPMGGGAAPGDEGQAVALNSNTPNSNTAPPTLLGGLPSAGDSTGAAVPSPVNTPAGANTPIKSVASASSRESSPPTALQPSVISAVWNRVDADHSTSWWSSGRPADSSSDPAGSSSDGSLEQLFSMLAFDRRRRHV
jgi:hypothetical protein